MSDSANCICIHGLSAVEAELAAAEADLRNGGK